LGANEGSRVTTVAVPDGGHAVAARVDAEGTIHLLFDAKDGPKYARSTDGGASFHAPLAIIGRDALRPGLEYQGWDLAVGQGGRVHVALGTNAWKLKLPREEWGFYYASLAPAAASFSPVRNINRHPSEGFSLATDERGNVAACWLSGKLYVNLSHDGGQTFSRAVEIDPKCDPCDCCTTSCTFTADGRLAVLYREETNNERDMFLVLWDYEEGRSVRHRISSTLWKIDACPMTYYSVTRRGDGFVAAWPTEGQVYFTRLDRWGKLLPPPEIKVPGSTGMRTGLVALSAADGTTLVAWKEKGEVRWQLYGADARPQGPPGAARSGGKGVAGVATKDGNFVLFR
jgi:hypothetical protein